MSFETAQYRTLPLRTIYLLLLLTLSGGCASFNPNPHVTHTFQQREATKSKGDFTVSIAVLSPKESKRVFDLNLAKKNIQPIWIKIENRGDDSLLFLPILVDQDYYAPLEASYKFRHLLSKKTTAQQDVYFDSMHMPHHIPPHSVCSGYVYGRMEAGVRFAKVLLVREHAEPVEFSFALPILGIQADFQRVDFKSLYEENEWIHVDDLDKLQKMLAELPRCTVDKKGKKEGDPLNLVLIGTMEGIVPALSERNWDVTEEIRLGSTFKTIKAFFIGSRYQFSPVSALYVFDRRQDAAFQKIRGTIHQRNHMRLWVTPIVYRGMPVSIGQISRDIGVRFSSRTGLTHRIDPDVDAARLYFAQDMLLTHSVEAIGYVGGADEAPRDAPRKNLTGDPYFTDGKRLVLILSEEDLNMKRTDLLDWEPIPLD